MLVGLWKIRLSKPRSHKENKSYNMNHPELQSYMSAGIDRIVSNAKKAALKNPKESLFLFRFAFSCRSAAKKRKASEEKGEHIVIDF